MIDDAMMTGVALWLGIYALHSTAIYAAVWFADGVLRGPSPALRATVWRAAMLAGVLTATLQFTGVTTPVTAVSVEHLAPPASVARSGADIAAAQEIAADTGASRAGPAFDPLALGLGLWLAGVAAFAARIGFAVLAARRQLAGRIPIVDGVLFARIQTLAREVGLRRLPQVSVSAHLAGPVTLPNGEICIPAWAYERFPRHQLDAMLAHEMAHVLRRDAFWLSVGLALQAVLFFQPLHVVARRRCALLAELAADDWAAAQAGNGRALAECLGEFAEIMGEARDPAFAAAMASGRSSLVRRVKRLLDESLPKYRAASAPARGLIWLAVAALAFALPGLTLDSSVAMFRQGNTSISRDDNGDLSIASAISTRDYRLTVNGQGRIVLAPDGSGVAEMSDGATFEVGLARNGREQRARFTGEKGRVVRAYWEGTAAAPWNAAAQRFVAEAMPIVFRETGLGAEARVAYLVKTGGADAFFAEAEGISSDGVQGRYVAAFAAQGPIAEAPFRRLMAMASAEIESDGGLAHTLAAVLDAQKPEGNALAWLVAAAATVDSDGESRTLLERVAALPRLSDAAAAAYVAQAATIGSDSEMHAALGALLLRKDIAPARVEQALELAAKELGSDSEMAGLLRDAAPGLPKEAGVRLAAQKALATIDSESLHKAVAAVLD